MAASQSAITIGVAIGTDRICRFAIGAARRCAAHLVFDRQDLATLWARDRPASLEDETIAAVVPIIDRDNQRQIGYVRITQSLELLGGGASPTENRTFHQLDIGLISG
ncbi:hypothetical protein [Chamaesiphon minutus]|uniref:hypothetical protein n=1 Tax=Chamaesiphon minutus TaxID=1173032 RepID=UPI0003029364|nr:hypothetical protein [Chamaesiphon minutus]